ncbi:MAG: periplasmic heavy metal sensor [Smithella sp.]
MKKVSVFFILSLLLLLIASQPSYAESRFPVNKTEKGIGNEGYPHPMTPPTMPCDMKQLFQFKHPDLNLDEKQKEAIKEIENSATKELIRKKAAEQIAEIELRDILDKDSVDLKAVEAKLKQIGTIKTESQLLIIKSVEKMKEKLNPKQRTLLKKRTMECRIKPPMTGKMIPDSPPSAGEKDKNRH